MASSSPASRLSTAVNTGLEIHAEAQDLLRYIRWKVVGTYLDNYVIGLKPSRRNLFMKRLLDISISLTALILTLPLLLMIALIIRMSSGSPVLFRQVRIGYGGQPFMCFKFRTMRPGDASQDPIHRAIVEKWMLGIPLNDPVEVAEFTPGNPPISLEGMQPPVDASTFVSLEEQRSFQPKKTGSQHPDYKLANDPRVTKIGRILRKTSLDELPQLVNVLLGDMSIVGPRPGPAQEVARYPAHAYARLYVKPGITGVWQVKGRGQTTFSEMVDMDLDYVRHNSLWRDVSLILRTIPAVVSGRGAA